MIKLPCSVEHAICYRRICINGDWYHTSEIEVNNEFVILYKKDRQGIVSIEKLPLKDAQYIKDFIDGVN